MTQLEVRAIAEAEQLAHMDVFVVLVVSSMAEFNVHLIKRVVLIFGAFN